MPVNYLEGRLKVLIKAVKVSGEAIASSRGHHFPGRLDHIHRASITVPAPGDDWPAEFFGVIHAAIPVARPLPCPELTHYTRIARFLHILQIFWLKGMASALIITAFVDMSRQYNFGIGDTWVTGFAGLVGCISFLAPARDVNDDITLIKCSDGGNGAVICRGITSWRYFMVAPLINQIND